MGLPSINELKKMEAKELFELLRDLWEEHFSEDAYLLETLNSNPYWRKYKSIKGKTEMWHVDGGYETHYDTGVEEGYFTGYGIKKGKTCIYVEHSISYFEGKKKEEYEKKVRRCG